MKEAKDPVFWKIFNQVNSLALDDTMTYLYMRVNSGVMYKLEKVIMSNER